jgi:spore germination cell wall hydrolase CwlJ-like protein
MAAATLIAASALAQTQQDVVAAVLVHEAGGEGLRGMEAVLEVIHTRANRAGSSLYEVVTRRFQFSCLNRTSPAQLVKSARRHPRWNEAVDLVRQGRVKTNWTRGATHYHEITINPGWPNRVAKIGRHVFYRFS